MPEQRPKPKPWADDLPYWKTGTSPADTWITNAIKEIERAGGKVHIRAEGLGAEGRTAFVLGFELQGDRFKLIWPVTPSRFNEATAARRQAATMLYHDVKARSVSARVLGSRVAFFSYLLLPDGRSAAELAAPELTDAFPPMLGRGT